MKYTTQCLAVLFTTASATLALASPCGCTHLAPVRERIVETRPSYTWSEPSLGDTIGNVITAPFRLVGGTLVWTGRALGGYGMAPVGERYTTVRTFREPMQPVGERVLITRSTTPSGERFIVTERSLPAVGERFTTHRIHTVHHKAMLPPVGEKKALKKNTSLKKEKSDIMKTSPEPSKELSKEPVKDI